MYNKIRNNNKVLNTQQGYNKATIVTMDMTEDTTTISNTDKDMNDDRKPISNNDAEVNTHNYNVQQQKKMANKG